MGRQVVSADASVLIVLAKAGRLGLLNRVFGEVLVESAVERECLRSLPERSDARAIEAALHAGALARGKAKSSDARRLARSHPNLGSGEVGALALAGRKGIVLLDDGLARRVARLEGSMPVGTLGVLARAHHLRVLADREAVASALRDVLQAGLWVDAGVVEVFWAGLRFT